MLQILSYLIPLNFIVILLALSAVVPYFRKKREYSRLILQHKINARFSRRK